MSGGELFSWDWILIYQSIFPAAGLLNVCLAINNQDLLYPALNPQHIHKHPYRVSQKSVETKPHIPSKSQYFITFSDNNNTVYI
jgi:hypothetical protein